MNIVCLTDSLLSPPPVLESRWHPHTKISHVCTYIYARKQDFLVHFYPKNVTQSSCSLLWSRQKRVCCYFVRKCGRRAGSSRIIMVTAGEQLNFSGALGAAVHQNSIQPNRRSALTGTVYSIFLSSKPVKFRCAIYTYILYNTVIILYVG